MNPCPCGHLGNAALSCSRAPRCAEAYQNKISGPLLDRIDLHVDVDAVNPWEMNKNSDIPSETSAQIRERVVAARKKQLSRQGYMNALLDGADMDKYVVLNDELTNFLNTAAEKMSMSARGYNRVKKIARTIADIEECSDINLKHITQAFQFKVDMI